MRNRGSYYRSSGASRCSRSRANAADAGQVRGDVFQDLLVPGEWPGRPRPGDDDIGESQLAGPARQVAEVLNRGQRRAESFEVEITGDRVRRSPRCAQCVVAALARLARTRPPRLLFSVPAS